jgi:hypothetical protein
VRSQLLIIGIMLAGIGSTQAQTPVTPPPTVTAPSVTTQQSQALLTCYANCDSRVGLCQGSCSQSNSALVTLAPATPGVRPDPGALTQCFLNCSTQQLACKQACAIR